MDYNIKRADNLNIKKSAAKCLGTRTYVEMVYLQRDLNKNEHSHDFAIGKL